MGAGTLGMDSRNGQAADAQGAGSQELRRASSLEDLPDDLFVSRHGSLCEEI